MAKIKEYTVYFSGSMQVEAENELDAQEQVYDILNGKCEFSIDSTEEF